MTAAVTTAILLGLIVSTHGNEFLKASPKILAEHVSEEDIRTSLLNEIEGTLGTGSATKRLSQIAETLRPIAAALPANEHGNLEHSAVRYALHRLFVSRHGWVIKGLGPDGQAENASSPAGVLKDQVPSYIQNLFEQRLGGKGFGLHELAVLGATIEHLIHNEAVSRLGDVFNVFAKPVTSVLNEAEASELLDTYMMAYILGEDLKKMTEEDARQLVAEMPETFLAWGDTLGFVHAVRKNLTKGLDHLDFAALAKVVEKIGEEFGTFQDTECQQLKDNLVRMEYRGTGRVQLSDFYKPALDGSWQFQESVGYLRQLGLLDESDPKQPSVMIANYVNAQSNCIASSGFYSVCCKNECESLLGHLERAIGASHAQPATIAALVAKLSSSTVSAPRYLSEFLLRRLDDIAANHGDMVPLHGRLFAQWMHHAYPRECSYPHISGTTSAMSPDEWADESGSDSTASEEEMQRYLSQTTNVADRHSGTQGDLAVEVVMPWSSEDEFFIVQPHGQAPRSWGSPTSAPASVRSVALLAAAGSLSFGIAQMVKAASLGESVSDKFV